MAPSPALTTRSAIEPQAPDVYRAICQVTKAIGHEGIAKDKQNTQGSGYRFRGIDDVYNALNAILAGAELCILPRMLSRTIEERATKAGGVLYCVTVDAEYDFVSARDGSKHTVKVFGEAMDTSDKATNKAMSAAMKYACFQTFCIPTEGMEDADATTHTPVPKQQAAADPAPWKYENDKPEPPKRPVPDELKIVFANMSKDKRHFDTARDSYMDRLATAGGAAHFSRLMGAYEALPKRTAADAKTLLLDLHTALGAAESKIGATT